VTCYLIRFGSVVIGVIVVKAPAIGGVVAVARGMVVRVAIVVIRIVIVVVIKVIVVVIKVMTIQRTLCSASASIEFVNRLNTDPVAVGPGPVIAGTTII
jgi:hypothetical protein